jgi:hypothetical protein
VLFLYSWKGGNGFSTRMVPKLQITSGEATKATKTNSNEYFSKKNIRINIRILPTLARLLSLGARKSHFLLVGK